METAISKLSQWLVKCNTIQQHDKELYEYAMKSILVSIIPLIFFMIISGILGMWWEGLLIVAPFMIIRKYSGGYHAKSAYTCFCLSIGMLSVCLYLILHTQNGMSMHFLICVSVVSLIKCSPIDSEHKRISAIEKKRNHYVTILLSVAALMIYFVFIALNEERYASCMAVSTILAAILQIPVILSKNV